MVNTLNCVDRLWHLCLSTISGQKVFHWLASFVSTCPLSGKVLLRINTKLSEKINNFQWLYVKMDDAPLLPPQYKMRPKRPWYRRGHLVLVLSFPARVCAAVIGEQSCIFPLTEELPKTSKTTVFPLWQPQREFKKQIFWPDYETFGVDICPSLVLDGLLHFLWSFSLKNPFSHIFKYIKFQNSFQKML